MRGRMPTLEIINDRFARALRIGLFNFMRRTPGVSVGSVRVIKFSEFIRSFTVPTSLNIIQAKPLRGSALIVLRAGARVPRRRHAVRRRRRFDMRIEGRDFTPPSSGSSSACSR